MKAGDMFTIDAENFTIQRTDGETVYCVDANGQRRVIHLNDVAGRIAAAATLPEVKIREPDNSGLISVAD